MRIKLDEGAKVPTKGTEGSACYDLYSNEEVVIKTGHVGMVGTGVFMEIPRGYCGIISHRSSMNKRGVIEYGTVDSDYRGEVKGLVFNGGCIPYVCRRGERIGQIRFCKAETTDFEVVEELTETQRDGGFGSTGR